MKMTHQSLVSFSEFERNLGLLLLVGGRESYIFLIILRT
jgi:hypothetical protein